VRKRLSKKLRTRRFVLSVTLLDIARIAQVSESAVSRALHDHPRISVATRQRIKKIAEELEFDFNSHAQSLSTSKSGTIGVIVPNFGADARRTYYLDLLINDIRAELGRLGFDLLIAESGPHGPEQSHLRRLVRQRKVDGFVLIIAELRTADREILAKRDIPVVVVNSKPLPLAGQSLDEFSCFFTDNLAGGGQAAAHLIDRGCTNLICLADDVAGPEMVDRTLGFVTEAQRHGLNPEVHSVTSDFASTEAYVAGHLDRFRQADGVFCHTDVMACSVLGALQRAGLNVPGDVKVVGYDDIELGTYFSPQVTTVHQPREAIARLACARLASLLRGSSRAPAEHVSVTPHLVVRGST
jgi:LacI family transcriptional regulator